MRFDALNPVSLLPAQPTEAGTPVLSRLPFLLANVVPMPNLPDDGSKPEDKHSKNEAEQPDQAEQEEDELPEIFQLINPPDFRHLFEYYYFDKNRKLEKLKIKMRIFRGIKGDVGLSEPVKNYSGFNDIRTMRYGNTMFFHYTRPGKRFVGQM